MSSYSSIIKSTGIVGLVQIFKIVFGLLQSKVLAVLVGPSGFGIWSLFNSFILTVSSFSALGIDQAGVRQIARNSENPQALGQSIYTFRILLISLSCIAFTLICIFRNMISYNLFGSDKYSVGVVIAGLAICLNGLSQGCISVLNGLRKLQELAKSQILGYASGALFSIVFILLWGVEGIPYFILFSALTVMLSSIFFVKKQSIPKHQPNLRNFANESKLLLSIGIAIAYSAMIVALSTYFSQVYIRQKFGLEWVGIYNASNTIANVYINIILSAMGVDLMPRLAKVIENDKAVGRLVSDQMELGVLVSTIGVIGVLLFAPIIITLLYTSEFLPATEIIRWHVLSVALRVLSYPMSYVLIVKRKTIQYILIQTLLWGGSYVLLILFTKKWGESGLGANFLFAFLLYLIALFILNRKLLIISPLLKKLLSISWITILIIMLLNEFAPPLYFYLAGSILFIGNIFWIFYVLKKNMNINIGKKLHNRFYKKTQ